MRFDELLHQLLGQYFVDPGAHLDCLYLLLFGCSDTGALTDTLVPAPGDLRGGLLVRHEIPPLVIIVLDAVVIEPPADLGLARGQTAHIGISVQIVLLNAVCLRVQHLLGLIRDGLQIREVFKLELTARRLRHLHLGALGLLRVCSLILLLGGHVLAAGALMLTAVLSILLRARFLVDRRPYILILALQFLE